MENNYFTTGEFARICGVNKQTLFYYDKEGIFCPEEVKENGYRYYSYTQIETFTILTMLRDLGVSIKEIKAHMNSRSPEALISLLESRQAAIDEKIKALEWSRTFIENKIKVTREGQKATIGKVLTQNLPERFMVASDYKGPDGNAAAAEALGGHLEYCQSSGLYNGCPVGALIPIDSITATGYKYSKYYTIVESTEGIDREALSKAPGGLHLVFYDNKGYEHIGENCRRIMDYANKNALTLGDCFFEDLILDDLSTGGYFDYLVKLSVRVL